MLTIYIDRWNTLIYVACKPQYGAKLLRIIFDKVDEYIRKYDRTKYLTLFYSNERWKRNLDRIRYIIMLKSNISDVYSDICAKIKINLDDDLPLKRTISMDHVVILIKSAFNESHDRYNYNAFLENVHINNI